MNTQARSVRFFFVVCLLACGVISAPIQAHHSPVAFDTKITDFVLTGEIESVDVRNPQQAS